MAPRGCRWLWGRGGPKASTRRCLGHLEDLYLESGEPSKHVKRCESEPKISRAVVRTPVPQGRSPAMCSRQVGDLRAPPRPRNLPSG